MSRTTKSWNGRKEQRWGLVHLAKVSLLLFFLYHFADANMLHNRRMWRFGGDLPPFPAFPVPLELEFLPLCFYFMEQ